MPEQKEAAAPLQGEESPEKDKGGFEDEEEELAAERDKDKSDMASPGKVKVLTAEQEKQMRLQKI